MSAGSTRHSTQPTTVWQGHSALDPNWSNRPVVKELATKLAWAVGSTLHITYGERTKVNIWAVELALRVYQDYKNQWPIPEKEGH